MMLAGYLRQRSLESVPCRSVDVEVPANAEIIFEGHLEPSDNPNQSWSVGVSTGFYHTFQNLPRFQLSAVTHRSNPIFPTNIPGYPASDDEWLDIASEKVLFPLLKFHVPEIADFHCPRAGAGQNFVFVSIRKQYPLQAAKVMQAIWSFEPLACSKTVVVVDDDVDPRDEQAVWFRVGAHVHPGRDILFSHGPTHATDHAAPMLGMGHKMGIDATRKLADEGHPRAWPAELEMSAVIRDLVTHRWNEYGLGATSPAPSTIHRGPKPHIVTPAT